MSSNNIIIIWSSVKNTAPFLPQARLGASASIFIFLYTSGRLTWLVYIIGAVIGGRVSFASTDEHDTMDGELVCRYVPDIEVIYQKV